MNDASMTFIDVTGLSSSPRDFECRSGTKLPRVVSFVESVIATLQLLKLYAYRLAVYLKSRTQRTCCPFDVYRRTYLAWSDYSEALAFAICGVFLLVAIFQITRQFRSVEVEAKYYLFEPTVGARAWRSTCPMDAQPSS